MATDRLLDTNVVSHLWSKSNLNSDEVFRKMQELGPGKMYVSVVSLGEIEYGHQVTPQPDPVQQARTRAEMERAFGDEGMIKVYPLCEIEERKLYETYAELRAGLFKKYGRRDRAGKVVTKRVSALTLPMGGSDRNLGIEENDVWLASLAISSRLVFATHEKMERIREVGDACFGTDFRLETWLREAPPQQPPATQEITFATLEGICNVRRAEKLRAFLAKRPGFYPTLWKWLNSVKDQFEAATVTLNLLPHPAVLDRHWIVATVQTDIAPAEAAAREARLNAWWKSASRMNSSEASVMVADH